MKVLVRGRNVDVTDALKDYVEKRVGKLDKFLDGAYEATVILMVEGDSHKVEVTVPFNGMILRGEEATGDMYSSIDLIVDKLEKQIEKYKGKLSRRRGAGDAKMYADQPRPVSDDDEELQVVKTKRFAIKPMPVDEAVMQMNLLGHSFFVFSNAETEQVNVVYKRKDGKYGLIEPEF
ncbi:ribosome hibernation-promoting factor, HPF/YfiA family [Desulfallas thermosapovorans]|uniref:Ribosome hibernation promoting factor n=1 Tax=Desulfallas thermosapovorans DSM 6562 TaxID=1121431 RepID=A0A5S4ZQ54_9FIRM|nr:ribosome-associated translation inhibitor RaiA [Desulfallas thermosapovorans]TYO94812.1 SSU ribosomal protein S30P/sigma 54 modulation protein [Desulfallas thermosapovorans DSM 6562]